MARRLWDVLPPLSRRPCLPIRTSQAGVCGTGASVAAWRGLTRLAGAVWCHGCDCAIFATAPQPPAQTLHQWPRAMLSYCPPVIPARPPATGVCSRPGNMPQAAVLATPWNSNILPRRNGESNLLSGWPRGKRWFRARSPRQDLAVALQHVIDHQPAPEEVSCGAGSRATEAGQSRWRQRSRAEESHRGHVLRTERMGPAVPPQKVGDYRSVGGQPQN
jgi:hypothetical protein